MKTTACERCEGDGLAHGADRPFEWAGPGTYPGPCPVCGGSGIAKDSIERHGYDRCPTMLPNDYGKEQCGRKRGHEGKCCYQRGD